MEPHVIAFQRAPGNLAQQICFQTFLPALNWAVREKQLETQTGNQLRRFDQRKKGHRYTDKTKRGRHG